jgi:hypothetical protein
MLRLFSRLLAPCALTALFTTSAFAADGIDAAATGFMIICTGLVLMMTLTGLALYIARESWFHDDNAS